MQMKIGFRQGSWIAMRSIFAATLAVLLIAQLGVGADFKSKDYPVGYQPVLIEVYDFNGDGKLDLAVVNANTGNGNGTVSILLGNGDGTFQSAKTFDLGSVIPNSIAVADFNGDGKLDLAVGFSSTVGLCSGAPVYTLAGNGDGTFQTAAKVVELSSYYAYVAAGDVTGDGKADLVVQRVQADSSCNPGGGYSVFAGNGDGTFQAEQPVTSNPLDFNNDGIPDLVSVGGGGLDVFLGRGNGELQPLASGPEANAGFLVVSDWNGDHFQDQAFPVNVCNDHPICFTKSSYVAVIMNDGHGNFSPPQLVSPGYSNGISGSGILWLATADFNGDGRPDLAYINAGTPGFRTILGRGDGTFPALVNFNSGSGPGMLVAADLNGDGRPDVALANLNDGTISVALNTFPKSGADMAVSIGASASRISVTQNLTYSATVQNQGPEDATNVVVTDTLPTGMTLVSAAVTGGTCSQANLVVMCSVNKLVSGDATALTIVVVPTTTGTAKNSLSVTATETDENTVNNAASVSITVVPMLNLSVTFQDSGTGSVVLRPGSSGFTGGGTCTATCNFSLPYGFPLSLLATAGANSGFGGWGGACAPGNSPVCEFNLTSDATAIANFDTLPNFVEFLQSPLGTVQAGQGVNDIVIVDPEGNSFDSSVTLTCSVQGGATPAPVCTLSPTSVTPGSAGGSAGMTVTTTGPAQASSLRTLIPIYALSLPLFGIAIVGCCRRQQSGYGRWPIRFVICLSTLLMIQLACGGGNGGAGGRKATGGTPPGNYTITVTAQSGAIEHSTSATLTVAAN